MLSGGFGFIDSPGEGTHVVTPDGRNVVDTILDDQAFP
ncbi:MAG: hypothetical protein J07HQX50_01680 [Haloquadratum sp. J07HQX50]|nr:MAG: hypothetical protein J07HQX50_01680 [Haloquadratum sp. J07HQX50]